MVDGKRTWIRKQPNKFYTYVGTEANPNQVIELEQEFRGHKYWHNYSDKQIEALRKWSRYIALRDGIDISKGLPELVRTMGAFKAFDFCDVKYVTANPGLWCHTNVQHGSKGNVGCIKVLAGAGQNRVWCHMRPLCSPESAC